MSAKQATKYGLFFIICNKQSNPTNVYNYFGVSFVFLYKKKNNNNKIKNLLMIFIHGNNFLSLHCVLQRFSSRLKDNTLMGSLNVFSIFIDVAVSSKKEKPLYLQKPLLSALFCIFSLQLIIGKWLLEMAEHHYTRL